MQDVKILSTCREKIDLSGVVHKNCINNDLIICIAHRDKVLVDYLGVTKIPIARDIFGSVELPAGAIMMGEGTTAAW